MNDEKKLNGYEKQTVVNSSASENNDFVEPKKGSKILLIVLLIVFSLFIAGLIIGMLIIKFYFTADRFLDNQVKNVNTYIDELFGESSIDMTSFNYLENDVKLKGNVLFMSNMTEYQAINNISIDFETYMSLKNHLLSLDLNLKNADTNTFSGLIYIDNNIGHIDSPNIYSRPLYIKSDDLENYFNSLNENELFNIFTNVNNIKQLFVRYLQYFAEALKEADMKTEGFGLEITYIYDINDSNKKAIANKFNELISNDVLYKEIFNYIDDNSWEIDADDLSNMQIVINASIIDEKIKSFTITGDDYTLVGEKVNDNKFMITDDAGDYLEIEMYENEYVFNLVIDDKNELHANIKNENNSVIIESILENTKINLEITNDGHIELLYSYDDISISFSGNNVLTNANTIDYDGEIEINYSGSTIGLKYDCSLETGKNIMPIKTFENEVDINTLPEEELYVILSNLQNLMNNLPIDSLVTNY